MTGMRGQHGGQEGGQSSSAYRGEQRSRAGEPSHAEAGRATDAPAGAAPNHEVTVADGAAIDRLTPTTLLRVTRDTLRKRDEQLEQSRAALREQTRILQAVLDGMTDGVVVVAPDGRLVLCNPAATRLVGLEHLAFLSTNPLAERPADLRHPGSYGTFRADGDTPCPRDELPLVRALRGLPVEEVDVLLRTARRPEGSWLRFNARPLSDVDGRPIGALAVFRDVTERRRAEQDLARSNAELEQFAYAVSHDLKEPVRVVSSYAQLLARRYRGQLGADADEYIGAIVQGVTRAYRLIDGLLDYSRVGRESGASRPTDASLALDNAVANLETLVLETHAELRRGPLPPVMADPAELVRVFQNLLSNALKFHGDSAPVVTISGEARGDDVVYSVTDNGIGIAPEHFERIFVIFQRLHPRAKYPGTGLGLAICKRIVERHSGTIWVESRPGEGATFRFTLAAART